MCIPPQLTALAGTLRALELGGNCYLGTVGGAFAPLTALTGITQLGLAATGLEALPNELSILCLSGIAGLDVSHNPGLGTATQEGGAGFEGLQLARGLTRLEARSCSLGSLPTQLSALAALQELALDENACLGAGGGEALRPLGALTTLRRLSLSCCGGSAGHYQLVVPGLQS